MKSIFLYLFVVLFLFSCTNPNPASSLINTDQLTAQSFAININRDTVLKTSGGAFLDIPKGSITSTDSLVQLDIKEAYDAAAIIKAGLITQSNGEPLRSGGMLYFNARAGQKITITKPIRVAVPTKFIDKNMQLYKGEEKDGRINWIQPKTLKENPVVQQIDAGEILFKDNCRSCHKIDMDFVGPMLANVIKRKGKTWTYNFSRSHGVYATTDSAKPTPLVSESDNTNLIRTAPTVAADINSNMDAYWDAIYTNCLEHQFMSRGAPFLLPNTSLELLYRYVQNETERLHVPLLNKASVTSCLDSMIVYLKKAEKLYSIRNQLVKNTVPQNIENFAPPADYQPTGQPPVYPENGVSPEDHQSLYYQFTIDVTGWYNIDALLNSFDGKTATELRVRLIGAYHTKVSVHLEVPQINTFLEGGKLTGSDDVYGFYTKDGRIPLPLNAKAYIVAMGEADGNILFAKKEFTVSKNQSFDINPEVVTKEQFTAAISTISTSNINIEIKETETGRDLKKVDEQIKALDSLKPKRCDCGEAKK
ncbi:MAG: hypothetical protein JST86_16265 [Bacteroidetes bacterium]|nr:hypothetical protein [Bacteroidota bacterium]